MKMPHPPPFKGASEVDEAESNLATGGCVDQFGLQRIAGTKIRCYSATATLENENWPCVFACLTVSCFFGNDS